MHKHSACPEVFLCWRTVPNIDRAALVAQAEECPIDQMEVGAYFQLQHCIDGLGRLLKALMGVSLVKVLLEPGTFPTGPQITRPPAHLTLSKCSSCFYLVLRMVYLMIV